VRCPPQPCSGVAQSPRGGPQPRPRESGAMPLHRTADPADFDDRLAISPLVAGAGQPLDVPRYRLPDGPLAPEAAYQIIHDELLLDGNARLNLATFVSTWMEPQAERLITECLAKNMIDKDEYPQTAELERRCVNILADLWNAERSWDAVGCSTT